MDELTYSLRHDRRPRDNPGRHVHVTVCQRRAEIHDASEGYEVTTHYVAANNIEAGHHLFNGASPETSSTSVWLDDTGLVGSLPTVAAVEQQNAGHTWTFQHAGGPLLVTFYDDYYGDNQGPGTRLCIDVSP